MKTQLSIELRYPLNEGGGASYSFSQNTIRYIDLKLSKCQTKGCIDGLLSHELGHACQGARVFEANGGRITDYDSAWKKTDYVSLFDKNLGVTVRSCVFKALDGHATNARATPSIGWRDEAFADLIFISNWNLERIAYECGSLEDTEHSQAQVYLHCLGGKFGILKATTDVYQYQEAAVKTTIKNNGLSGGFYNKAGGCNDVIRNDLIIYSKLKTVCPRLISTFKLTGEGMYNHSDAEIERKFPGITRRAVQLELKLWEVAICTQPDVIVNGYNRAVEICPLQHDQNGKTSGAVR